MMNVKDESTLSLGLKALIREKCDKGFVAKNEKRGDIGCLRKNCSMTFSNSSQLKQHVRTHDGGKDGIYKCEKCGNVFNDPISLEAHKNHLTLCDAEENISSLKLDKSLDQNMPTRRGEYYVENLSPSDVLAELIMFSPNSSQQTPDSSIPKTIPPGSTCSSS